MPMHYVEYSRKQHHLQHPRLHHTMPLTLQIWLINSQVINNPQMSTFILRADATSSIARMTITCLQSDHARRPTSLDVMHRLHHRRIVIICVMVANGCNILTMINKISPFPHQVFPIVAPWHTPLLRYVHCFTQFIMS